MSGQFIDLDLLTRYDGKIKNFIQTEDSKSIRSASVNANTGVVNFYKSEDASGNPYISFTLPDVSDFISKVNNATAGNFVVLNSDGSISDGGNSIQAVKISITDEDGNFTSTNVEGALAELAAASSGGVDSKTIWGVDASAGQSEYAKVYKIYQGANPPNAQSNPAELKLTINLPKDKVLQDSIIVTITYDNGHLYDGVTDVTEIIKGSGGTATQSDAGKYMKFIMQNVTDPLYANLSDFIDIYTGGTNTEATVTVNGNNQILVAIGKINATKIIYREADTSQGITEMNIKTKVDNIETFVGSIPSGSSATSVVGYVDEKTTLATTQDIDNLFT